MEKYRFLEQMNNKVSHQEIKLPEGGIYVVATPIGNLEDISIRSLRVLNEVDYILCEDTRKSLKLLTFFNIKKKLYSYYEWNQEKRIPQVMEKILLYKKTYALISDSGTPCISDPGNLLIRKAIENKITIIPIPGPSALVTLLSVSGFKSNYFEFYGFLPRKQSKRKKILSLLSNRDGIFIFYESPHRIKKILTEIIEYFNPESEYVIGQELTKKFEGIYYGKIKNLEKKLNELVIKGEYTFLIENFKSTKSTK